MVLDFAIEILFFFFFLMIRRPPRSTLFPYTDALPISSLCESASRLTLKRVWRRPSASFSSRSEEHTSELQSHHDLVCRLLLEKKKKNIIVAELTKNNSKQT